MKIDGDSCSEGGSFAQAETVNGCARPNRLKLAIEFQPLNRPEIAYVVYRTSSVEISEDGMGKGSGRADLTPIRIAFQNGAKADFGNEPAVRKVSGVYVPYYPLPRRDCFSVRAIDEYGRERGDVTNEKCVELFPLEGCGESCPFMVGCFPIPMESEGMDAQAGQSCDTIGLNGAEADTEIPEIGAENDGTSAEADVGGSDALGNQSSDGADNDGAGEVAAPSGGAREEANAAGTQASDRMSDEGDGGSRGALCSVDVGGRTPHPEGPFVFLFVIVTTRLLVRRPA